MADDSQQKKQVGASDAQQSSGDSGKSKKKNPLDVLENLLSEIEEKQGIPGKDKASGPTKEELEAQELERKRKEYEEQRAKQAEIDRQRIEQQRQALEENMQTSEQNIVRHQQDAEKQAEQEQKKAEQDGYEIAQLDHTKI